MRRTSPMSSGAHGDDVSTIDETEHGDEQLSGSRHSVDENANNGEARLPVDAMPRAPRKAAVTHLLLGAVAVDDVIAAAAYDVAKRMPWVQIVNANWLRQFV